MLENDYPVPSYIAETFEKTEGWVETPKPSDESLAHKSPRIFAIDCEMVCLIFMHRSGPLNILKVSNRGRQGIGPGLHD